MLADTTDRPGVSEQYVAACGSSNLRVGNDHKINTPGDMTAAAGMSKHHMGLALRRLLAEWDKSAKPIAPTAEQVRAIAETLPREEDGKYAGMVREDGVEGLRYRKPQAVAFDRARKWHRHEMRLLMQSLKSLPAVRAGLLQYEPGEYTVAAVLLWWLHPVCPECAGRTQRLIAGTNHLNGRDCKPCRATGRSDAPAGGERLASYITICLAASGRDLHEGAKSMERSASSLEAREEAAAKHKAAQLAANPEIAQGDRARVARHFELGKK